MAAEGAGGRGRGGGARHPPLSALVVSAIAAFSAVIVLAVLHSAYNDAVSRTRTLLGHNLEPTPWHPFPHAKGRPPARAALRCAPAVACLPPLTRPPPANASSSAGGERRQCPAYFAAIHRDLAPWRRRGGVTRALLDAARRRASMRVTITGGGRRLHVDLYYACVQSRALFTVWSLLQLMRRYPGRVPDVDLMFDCMDRPAINRTDHAGGDPAPPPLFRYCTTRDHFDIPFPDWSFWGWPETNIEPWDREFASIKLGAAATRWADRVPTAYWKGNPDVASPLRVALLGCNDTGRWRAEILRQNWDDEARSGYRHSKLSGQCTHRYKIYAEGFAWSVSLKYILSCGSMALLIEPRYQDFFSRGLQPRVSFWPVVAAPAPAPEPEAMCESIRDAVDWGNANPAEAERVGERGQRLMQDLRMDAVYDYMLHLLTEYAALMDFRPAPPHTAQEACEGSVLCIADDKQRRFLEASAAETAVDEPCVMPPPPPLLPE